MTMVASASDSTHHSATKTSSSTKEKVNINRIDAISKENLHQLYSEFIAASYLEDTNRHDRASELYLKALALAPQSPFLLFQAGNALLRSGKTTEAIRIAEKAIKETTPVFEIYELLGRAYLANQEWDKATLNLEKAAAENPNSIQTLTDLSLLYIRDNHFESAITLFRKMAAADPTQAVLYNYKAAALLFQLNRFDEAQQEYLDIIKQYPQFYEACMQLGAIYEIKGEQDKAIETYKNALNVVKNNDEEIEIRYRLGSLYQTQKGIDEAFRQYNRIKELDSNELKAWKATLAIYVSQGDYGKALKEGIELGKKTPGDYRIHLLLKEIYAKQNQEEEGYKQFLLAFNDAISNKLEQDCLSYLYEITQSGFVDKCREFSLTDQIKQSLSRCSSQYPKFIRNFFALASFGLATNNKSMLADGLKSIVSAVEEIPKNKDQKKLDSICFDYLIWYKIRYSFIEMGIISKMESAFNQCKSFFPEDVELLRALSQSAIDQQKWESAKNFLFDIQKQLEEDSPYRKELVLQIALVYDKLNQLDPLESLLQEAMKEYPSDAQIYNFLGYTYADRNIKLDEARSLVEKAQSLDPEDGNILDSLGWVYYRLGKNREAVLKLEEAAEMEKNHPVIMDHLGDAYLQEGQTEKALSTWKKSLQVGPDFPFEFTPEFQERITKKIKEAETRSKP